MQNSLKQYVVPPNDAIYPRDTEKLIAWDRTASGRVITLTVVNEKTTFRTSWPIGGITYPAQRINSYTLVFRKNGRVVHKFFGMQKSSSPLPSFVNMFRSPAHRKLVQGWTEYHW